MSNPDRQSRTLCKRDYEVLANFRYALREFLAFSESAAAAVDLRPQQYQALLAIKGSRNCDYLSVGEMSEQLKIWHHTAVELTNRLELRGLVRRKSDPQDARRVRVHLTPKGEGLLECLAHAHIKELQSIRPALQALITALGHRSKAGILVMP